MERRDFLRRTIPVTTIPFLVGGLPLRAYGRSPLLDALTLGSVATDRVLILVQLGGGNDGINTVIPRDQYSAYFNARQNIAIPEGSILPLTTRTGLHPVMSGMKSLYDNARLSIVQGVSYPNPDLSHFRATDIWLTAANSNEYLTTGWLGRYFHREFEGYPEGYPNEVMPDPLAIQIGAEVSPMLHGESGPAGISLHNPDAFYQMVQGGEPIGDTSIPETRAGKELAYIRHVSFQSQEYAGRVKAASERSQSAVRSSLYPARGANFLADQLKIVATLIAGGLKTRIYIVNLFGFDSHAGQVESGNTTVGVHAVLLERLSTALMAFQDDLRLLNLEDRVLGMTFSEFGRRVHSNSSLGTDHGTAAPVFLFGKGVRAGIIGSNPDLATLDNGNLGMQFDFRSIYGSVLHQWFGADDSNRESVLLRDFPGVPVIRPAYHIDPSGNRIYPASFQLHNNYPNPFNPSTTISYDLADEAHVLLEVFDLRGRLVSTLVNSQHQPGHHQVKFTAGVHNSSGMYVYRMRIGALVMQKRMMLVR